MLQEYNLDTKHTKGKITCQQIVYPDSSVLLYTMLRRAFVRMLSDQSFFTRNFLSLGGELLGESARVLSC